ncbi:MAG: hypothetical protein PHV55_02150 [Candidatus Omnitrophica bacterium]|nr:hypothetical protein [Candidatus Omnitrophota bacterium]
MQEDMLPYSIAWIFYNEDSETARSLNAPGSVVLPYFVSEDDLTMVDAGDCVGLDEWDLLRGLMVEFFTPPPMSVTHKIKPYFEDILYDLLGKFLCQNNYDSVEQCIIAIIGQLKNHGESVCARALKTGLAILPHSLKIKNALSQIPVSKLEGPKNVRIFL